jgi:hypothetical protein
MPGIGWFHVAQKRHQRQICGTHPDQRARREVELASTRDCHDDPHRRRHTRGAHSSLAAPKPLAAPEPVCCQHWLVARFCLAVDWVVATILVLLVVARVDFHH